GGDGATATAVRIAILAFLADLATAAALAWGWGRRPATVYLLLGLPLLSFIYLRFDLVSVALATWALAWARHRGEALGGAALGLAVMTKLWPLALAPVFLLRRACEGAIWRRAGAPDRDPAGGAALAAVVALVVFSPQFSLQYAAWFLPWTALAFEGDHGDGRTATIAALAVVLTGFLALA